MPWFLHHHRDYIPVPTGDDKYTAEGTAAHERAASHLTGERLLKRDNDPVWVYINYIEAKLEEAKAHFGRAAKLVEAKVPLYYDPGYEGTVDFAVFDPFGGMLDIVDLKFGQGVDVEAVGNTQTAIYWRSLYDHLINWGMMDRLEDDSQVILTIVQPRHWNAKKIDKWETTVGEILDFTDSLGLVAEKIYRKKVLEFNPSTSTCQFCAAKAVCVERHKWDLANLPEMEGNVSSIDADTIKKIYERRYAFRKWLDEIEKFIGDNVSAGGEFSQWFHWTEGARQGNTRWHNEKKAMRVLRKQWPELTPKDFYKKSFLSPNQVTEMVLEKVGDEIGKEYFAEQGLTYRPPGKQVLAVLKDGEVSREEEIVDMFD